MDKNLINIDDLVRQRLGGGEEREQSGSWMRMRELLDKEMPQRPTGGIPWPRIYSAIAVIVLIAGISVGGYKLSYFKNISKEANIIPVASTAKSGADNTAANVSNNTKISTTENKEKETNTSNVTVNQKKKGNGHLIANSKTVKAADGNPTDNKTVNNTENKVTQDALPSTTSKTNTDVTADDKKVAVADNASPKNTDVKANETSGNKQSMDGIALSSNANTVINNEVAPVKTKTTGITKKIYHPVVALPRHSSSVKSISGSEKADKDRVGYSTSSTSNIKKSTANNKSTNRTVLHNKRNAKQPENKIAGNKPSETTGNKATTDKRVAANTPPNSVDDNKVTTDKKSTDKTGPDSRRDDKQQENNIAGNNTSDVTGDKATSDKVLAANTPSNTNKDHDAITNKKQTHKAVAAKQSEKEIAGNNPSNVVAAPGSSLNNTAKKETLAKNPRKGQKQIEKLVVTEHYIKTEGNPGYFHLDTISREIVTEEYDIAANNFPPLLSYGPQPYEVALARYKSSKDRLETNSKEGAHSKLTGSNSLEGLHAAFNEVKNKFVGTHFAPGLTAGINSTFFGPTSFKGFQFGVNGNFLFSDKVSAMCDIKYFHRINNDYTLNDNYYTYTQVGPGEYTKELVNNPYSFSTLHSIEMPLYIRYTTGNFNFFMGGNFVYSFSINTGAYPLADPNSITKVSAIENDNTPKLKAEDFNSRFGVGYLFGVSYQVTSKVTIDLRNVQTVWDNGKSTGSKIISDQLYKSPSLQLSIGYQLGGNKGRNEEQ